MKQKRDCAVFIIWRKVLAAICFVLFGNFVHASFVVYSTLYMETQAGQAWMPCKVINAGMAELFARNQAGRRLHIKRQGVEYFYIRL